MFGLSKQAGAKRWETPEDTKMARRKTYKSGRFTPLADLGRFALVDVNPYHYNCGHYPEWAAVRNPAGAFSGRAAAEASASARNARSHARWLAYLEA